MWDRDVYAKAASRIWNTGGKTCLWNSSTGWGWHIVWKMWNMGGRGLECFIIHSLHSMHNHYFIHLHWNFIHTHVLWFLNYSLSDLKKAWDVHVVFVILLDLSSVISFVIFLLLFSPFFVFFLFQFNRFLVFCFCCLSLFYTHTITNTQTHKLTNPGICGSSVEARV